MQEKPGKTKKGRYDRNKQISVEFGEFNCSALQPTHKYQRPPLVCNEKIHFRLKQFVFSDFGKSIFVVIIY